MGLVWVPPSPLLPHPAFGMEPPGPMLAQAAPGVEGGGACATPLLTAQPTEGSSGEVGSSGGLSSLSSGGSGVMYLGAGGGVGSSHKMYSNLVEGVESEGCGGEEEGLPMGLLGAEARTPSQVAGMARSNPLFHTPPPPAPHSPLSVLPLAQGLQGVAASATKSQAEALPAAQHASRLLDEVCVFIWGREGIETAQEHSA